MRWVTYLVMFLTAALAASPAYPCFKVSPDGEHLDKYSSVFIGEVTGIRRDGRENELLGRPDICAHELCMTITDGASPTTVFAVPTTVARGNAKGVQSLSLVGCTFTLPKLGEQGIFFVNAGSTSAITIWESDKKNFKLWRKRLGLKTADR